MKVERVVFRGLKALVERDDRLAGEPNAPASPSVCLRGLNGSGKTTYLEAIASIWRLFRRWSQRGIHIKLRPKDPLSNADLVAVKLIDLPGPAPSLWLVYGERELWEAIPNRGDALVAGVLRTGKTGGPKNLLERDAPLYRFWDDNATKLEQVGERGSAIPLPNVVMIGAEDRFIKGLPEEDDLFELAQEKPFLFLARYEAADKKAGHIENSLAALLAVAPDKFAEVSKKLRLVLPRIELLNRADAKTRRPLVKLASGAEVTLDQLSAGERAALIALFMVMRWMTRGGVVLIDEPELHQHLSLMRANLGLLEHYVVTEMGGQLIVASHAPEVWDHFRIRRPILDLDISSGEVVS